MKNLKSSDFLKLARQHKSSQMKMRLLALAHFPDGQSRTTIAKFLKVSRTSVNKWISAYLNAGIEALNEKPRPGRPHFLTDTQQTELCQFIEERSHSTAGGRLTGYDIQSYISDNFAIEYHSDYVYILLRKLGFSWKTSRSRHPKQSLDAQEDFKKILF